MKLDDIKVSDKDGREVDAKLAVCDCGSSSFAVIQVVGQTHFHLQCDKCGHSFCPHGGDCY